MSAGLVRAAALMPLVDVTETVVLVGLGTVAVAALVVFLFVRALRTQVKTRTTELERRAGEIEDLNAQLEIGNEELQTSKEELESANEELTLLNADLEARNRELSRINEELGRLKGFTDRVIATLPAALLVVDDTRRVLAANRQYEAERLVEQRGVVGRPLEAALPDDLLYAGGVLDAVDKAVRTGGPVQLTAVAVGGSEGGRRHYDVTVTRLIATEPGNETPTQLLLAMFNVTEKHRLGLAVREQERYLRRLVENPLVAIVTCTPEWRIDLFNEGAERLTGYTSSEMAGRELGAFLVEGLETTRERLESGQAVDNVEVAAGGRSGAAVPLALFATPLEGGVGDRVGYLLIGTDLRQRKAMEEHLLRRNRELAMLYDVARALNQSLDLDKLLDDALDRLLKAFPADCCCVMLTSEPRAAVEPTLRCTRSTDPEIKATCQRLRSLAMSRLAHERAPFVIGNLLESPQAAELVAAPDENASLAFVPLMVRDELVGTLIAVSSAMQLLSKEELALLTSVAQSMAAVVKNVRLYNDLGRTLADLKQAQEQLLRTEKLRSLGELAAGVAHDFNNVLGIILGHAQFLLEISSDQPLVEGLRAIEQAAKDGARTVERVQDFVRAKQVEGFAPVDLNSVVLELARIAETRIRQESALRDVRIELKHAEGTLEPVAGDERDLREALTNIVLNAVDAMPDGGTLSIESGQDGRQVYVRVTDTGIGMDAATQSRMFDPFFTTKGPRGTGLGLSVAYGIVRHHRGTISVESKPGKGTRVTLTLPVMAETIAEIAEPEEAVAGIGGAASEILEAVRVLLIDDNVELNRIIQGILTKAGHEVEIAHDGPSGLDAFERGAYDLVITDIGMPGMSGWDVAKAIKTRNARTGVILLTGWDRREYRQHPYRSHADALLAKPVDRDKLLRVMGTMARRRSKWPEISMVAEDDLSDEPPET